MLALIHVSLFIIPSEGDRSRLSCTELGWTLNSWAKVKNVCGKTSDVAGPVTTSNGDSGCSGESFAMPLILELPAEFFTLC